MKECTDTVNDLVNAYVEQKNFSRRKNIKMRGVPETVPPSELQAYAINLFSTLIPELTQIELTINRIHRIPKPQHLEDSIPRDVLMRIHYYLVNEQILSKARAITTLPAPYTQIQIYAGLSQHTLQMRRELKAVTKALNNHKLVYKWRHQDTLPVTSNWASCTISTIESGMKLLHCGAPLTHNIR